MKHFFAKNSVWAILLPATALLGFRLGQMAGISRDDFHDRSNDAPTRQDIWHGSDDHAFDSNKGFERIWSRLSKTRGWSVDYALRESLLEAWALVDPAEAMVAAQALSGSAREAARAIVLETWLRRDFAGAVAWIRAVEPGFVITPIFRQAVRERGDFATNLELIGTLNISRTSRQIATERIAADWAERDMVAAQAALNAAPPDRRMNLALGVLETWAKSDPLAAVQWANTFLTSGDDRRTGITRAMQVWVKDPAQIPAATNWIDSQPATSDLFVARMELASALVLKSDIGGAFDQLTKITDLRIRDEGLYFSAFKVGNRSPATAVKIVEHVSNPADRFRYVASHVENWWTQDPAAARAYVTATDRLSPTQKQQLLARLGGEK